MTFQTSGPLICPIAAIFALNFCFHITVFIMILLYAAEQSN